MLYYENRVEDFYMDRLPNMDFLPHIHHNLELLICTAGELGTCCGGSSRVLRPGDMMIAFSYDIHSYGKTGGGEGILMIVNPELLPLLGGRLRERRYANYLAEGGGFYIPLAEAAYREYRADRSREILVGYLYVILGTALKELPYEVKNPRLNVSTFSRVLEYLSEHYTGQVSLESLAKRFGVAPCYLSRMFSEKLSYGFLKYLHTLRIEHAKNLLRNTDLKITDILMKSGFSDQKTFNRVFRELTDMTPGEYRRSQRLPEGSSGG